MKKKYGYPINRTFPLLIIEKFSDLFIITTFVLFSLWMHFSMISTIILLTSYAVLVAFVAVLFNKKVFNVIKKILKKMPFISRSLDGIEEVDINIKKIFRLRSLLYLYL